MKLGARLCPVNREQLTATSFAAGDSLFKTRSDTAAGDCRVATETDPDLFRGLLKAQPFFFIIHGA